MKKTKANSRATMSNDCLEQEMVCAKMASVFCLAFPNIAME